MGKLGNFILLMAFLAISWKQASWAVQPDYFDPRSSLHQSGVKTPREYFLPQTPEYNKLDPNEYKDYLKQAYSPYAFLTISQAIHINETILSSGYYLVKKTPTSLVIKQSGEIKASLPIVSTTLTEHSKKRVTKASWVTDNSNSLNPQTLYLQYCDEIGCYKTGPVLPGLLE